MMASKIINSIVLAAALGCGPSLSNQEILRNRTEYHTELEMSDFRRQGLELEAKIEGETSANIWTTIDARVLMERKDELIEMIKSLFTDQSNYLNSFCPHPVNQVEIILDNIGNDFGSVPSYSRIIVLDEESFENLLDNPENIKRSIALIHEYAHVQENWLDYNEPLMYRELSSIIVESLNAIRVHGFEFYKKSYRINFDKLDFQPIELLGDQAGYYAIRTLAMQFMMDAFEGRITWEGNIPPLEKMEQFTGLYFTEEKNGSEGFDDAASDAGLLFNDRPLRLNGIRRRAFENEVR